MFVFTAVCMSAEEVPVSCKATPLMKKMKNTPHLDIVNSGLRGPPVAPKEGLCLAIYSRRQTDINRQYRREIALAYRYYENFTQNKPII